MKAKWLFLSLALGLSLCAGLLVLLYTPANALPLHAAALPATIEDVYVAPELRAQAVYSTAYLVVRFADADTIVRPVTFTQPISAYTALVLSGLAFTTQDTGFGPFLCSIEQVGDSSGACDNGTQYWGTYVWNAASADWAMRMVGIAEALITQTGHIEGFSWSDPGWAGVAPAPGSALVAAQRGLDWLLPQAQPHGGYGTSGNTAEVLIALGANRQTPAPATLAHLLANGRTLAGTAAGAGKLALALTPHHTCWPWAAPQPGDYYDPATGAFATDAAPHALAMLGTVALSQTLPPSATTYLLGLQQANGGWEWGVGWGADTNSTALALQALIAAGESPTATAIISGLTYLEQAQNSDGGFPYDPDSQWGTDSDTNSTAYVVQALLAVGEDPLMETWAISDTHPIAYLLNRQLPNGSFEWQPGFGANQAATQQVIPALLHQPFPIRVAALEPCRTVFLPLVARE